MPEIVRHLSPLKKTAKTRFECVANPCCVLDAVKEVRVDPESGYFESTFRQVKLGDTLLCYVKAPAKRWVGALRVEGRMYLDSTDPVWGTEEGAGR